MKVLVLIVAAFVAVNAQTAEQKEKVKHHVKLCSEKVGIPEDEGQNLVYKVITDNKESYQCFAKCFLEQSGFIDATGNFQRDVIFNKLSIALGGTEDAEVVTNLNELIDTCTKLTGSGECGTAFEVQNCYWRKIHGH
ncbi:general odorant-binding protein 56d-like [Chironomus tepperi]|uniref:general odorant-binding protein 56d-like n=1 Tax=Chironomus tepperi TaxID=113505 RepID=UPI00391FA01B